MKQMQLSNWYQTALGKEVAKAEALYLSQALAEIPGNHLLQLGSTGANCLTASRALHKCVVQAPEETDHMLSAIASYQELPFPNEMFDIVILPHVLETVDNYPTVLREAVRVLKGEGYLLMLGFNPYRLHALCDTKPPLMHSPSMYKLRFWLQHANCEIQFIKRFFFRPLSQRDKLLHKLQPMEKIGQWCWPAYGACYIVIARKKVLAMTTLNEKIENWWRCMTSKPVIEPSTRSR
jgi:SAM-dependent methyltransferase